MYWFILLPLLFVVTEAGQCPPGYSFCSAANKCYRVYEDGLPLMQAQYTCTQGGGFLATIPNEAANDFVLSLTTGYYYTIGASNLNIYYDVNFHTNSTKWFDGTPFNYSNFASRQPNTNDCVAMTKNGEWLSSSCNNRFSFVCSASPVCSTSTISSNSCPSGWTFYNKTSSCYRSFVNGNFNNSQLTCSSFGANLTSVTSADENTFLIGLAETGLPLSPNQQVWIGVRRQGNQWYNIDGSPVNLPSFQYDQLQYTYSNFGSLYPRPVDGDNNCAVLFADRWSSNPGFVGYWQDYSCSSTQRAYICKMPATSG